MVQVSRSMAAIEGRQVLTNEQIERWHALRMMIGFCREEAKALGADFLGYCVDLGIVAADDHMRAREGKASAPF